MHQKGTLLAIEQVFNSLQELSSFVRFSDNRFLEACGHVFGNVPGNKQDLYVAIDKPDLFGGFLAAHFRHYKVKYNQ